MPVSIYVTKQASNVTSCLMTCLSKKSCTQTSFCFFGAMFSKITIFMTGLKLQEIQEVNSLCGQSA